MLLFGVLFLSAISLFPRELLVGIAPDLSYKFPLFLFPIELSVGFFTIGSGISQLIAGGIGDSFDKKRILLWGSVFIVIGNILIFFSRDSFEFLLTRILVGIGSGVFTVLARALAAEHYHGEKLLKVMSWISMSATATPLVAPILGSIILSYLGLSWEFVILISIGVCSFFCTKQLNVPTINIANKNNTKPLLHLMINNFSCALKEKKVIPPMVISALFFGCGIGYLTISTKILNLHYDIPFQSLGYFFWPIPIGYLLGTFFATRFFSLFQKKHGYQALLIVNILMLMLVMLFQSSLIVFEMLVFFFFLSSGLFTPYLNKMSLAAKGKESAAASILGFLRTLFSFIYAFVASSLTVTVFSVASMFFISICLIYISLKHMRHNFKLYEVLST